MGGVAAVAVGAAVATAVVDTETTDLATTDPATTDPATVDDTVEATDAVADVAAGAPPATPNDAPAAEHTLRICMIGMERSGKTCLGEVFSYGEFPALAEPTIEDVLYSSTTLQNADGKSEIWKSELVDLSGDHLAYGSLWEQNIVNADAFVLVFSLDSLDSYRMAAVYHRLIVQLTGNDSPIMAMIGTKADLVPHAVPENEVKAGAFLFGVNYHPVSALTGTGVTQAFTDLLSTASEYLATHGSLPRRAKEALSPSEGAVATGSTSTDDAQASSSGAQPGSSAPDANGGDTSATIRNSVAWSAVQEGEVCVRLRVGMTRKKKWVPSYVVLTKTTLEYYKSKAKYDDGKRPVGEVAVADMHPVTLLTAEQENDLLTYYSTTGDAMGDFDARAPALTTPDGGDGVAEENILIVYHSKGGRPVPSGKKDKIKLLFSSREEKDTWISKLGATQAMVRTMGVPLNLILGRYDPRPDGTCRVVPMVVERVVRFLEDPEHDRIKTIGLYRKTGDRSAILELALRLDVDEADFVARDVQNEDPHAVAGVLKHYLADLPEPLLTWKYYPDVIDIMSAHTETNPSATIAGIRGVLSSLPPGSSGTFEFIMHHLARICSFADHNMMIPSNMAIIFGPMILRPQEELWSKFGGSSSLVESLRHQHAFVHFVLRNMDKIFDKGPDDEASVYA